MNMANERDILLAALKAAGHDQAYALAGAILPSGETAAVAPAPAELTPGQAYAQQQQLAAQAAGAAAPGYPGGPPPPAGKAPLQNLDEWETLPQAERLARMDEADALLLRGDH